MLSEVPSARASAPETRCSCSASYQSRLPSSAPGAAHSSTRTSTPSDCLMRSACCETRRTASFPGPSRTHTRALPCCSSRMDPSNCFVFHPAGTSRLSAACGSPSRLAEGFSSCEPASTGDDNDSTRSRERVRMRPFYCIPPRVSGHGVVSKGVRIHGCGAARLRTTRCARSARLRGRPRGALAEATLHPPRGSDPVRSGSDPASGHRIQRHSWACAGERLPGHGSGQDRCAS